MTAERAASLIVAMGLHACALWLLKPGEHKMVQMAGEPEGPTVNVELVEATAPEEAPAVVETPPEPTPPEPTPPPEPPVVEPPEPTPPPEPAPRPPDEMEEPIKEAPAPVPVLAPKPRPQAKPKPRPVAPQPAAKPGPPAQASAAPSGFQGAAARGSAKGDEAAKVRHINKPRMPESLNGKGIVPRATVFVVVSAEGRAIASRISKSSGYAEFDQRCLKAAREAVYKPKKQFGVPVQDSVLLPFRGE